MNQSRTLLTLGVLAVLMVGLIGLVRWHDKTAALQQQVMNEADVSEISIFTSAKQSSSPDHAGHANDAENTLALRATLKRRTSGWQLSRPVTGSDGTTSNLAVEANADRVAPLLALLQLPQRTSYPLDEIELAELGFVPPKARVQMDDIEFLFGDKTTDGTARYVQVRNRVHLYQEFVYPLLGAAPDIFAASSDKPTQ